MGHVCRVSVRSGGYEVGLGQLYVDRGWDIWTEAILYGPERVYGPVWGRSIWTGAGVYRLAFRPIDQAGAPLYGLEKHYMDRG